jgi:hypothetical protein
MGVAVDRDSRTQLYANRSFRPAAGEPLRAGMSSGYRPSNTSQNQIRMILWHSICPVEDRELTGNNTD